MTDIAPSQILEANVLWIQKLKHELWYPQPDYSIQAQREGMRGRRRRITRAEIDLLSMIIQCHLLRVDILATDGPQIKIFDPHDKELLRLSWWHIPAAIDDPRHRRRLARAEFEKMTQKSSTPKTETAP